MLTQRGDVTDFSHGLSLLTSTLELLPESRLGRIELLLLRRLCLLVSFGSLGLKPLARAYRFRTSVRDTTPDSFPDMLSPGSDAADMEGLGFVANDCEEVCSEADGPGSSGVPVRAGGRLSTAGWAAGVGGPDEEGEGESTIHILKTGSALI